ncbi:MAG: hypothetical protein ACREF4_21985 [Gammaproteobacteria bacterium]
MDFYRDIPRLMERRRRSRRAEDKAGFFGVAFVVLAAVLVVIYLAPGPW